MLETHLGMEKFPSNGNYDLRQEFPRTVQGCYQRLSSALIIGKGDFPTKKKNNENRSISDYLGKMEYKKVFGANLYLGNEGLLDTAILRTILGKEKFPKTWELLCSSS